MSKIGLFSGSFDPIHDGHLALAQNSIKRLGLEKVVLLVEPKPRRKQNITPYKKRLAMTKIATSDMDQIQVHEAPAGDAHSVEHTLQIIKNRHPKSEIVLIMGGDVFEYVPKWDGQQELKGLTFAVGLRTEDDGELAMEISRRHGYKIRLVETNFPKVSSSQIRKVISDGEKPGHVHVDVYKYIQKQGLYSDRS